MRSIKKVVSVFMITMMMFSLASFGVIAEEKVKSEQESVVEGTIMAQERDAETEDVLITQEQEIKDDRDQVALSQNTPSVFYSTHIQNIGWQNWKKDGQGSGTEGQGLRLEAVRIKVDKGTDDDLNVRYDTYIENYGWQAARGGGAESGQVGKGLRLEAIRVYLIGDDAEKYDIYYQVHAQNIGWLGWAQNGENAGTADFGYRLEGIQNCGIAEGLGSTRINGKGIYLSRG